MGLKSKVLKLKAEKFESKKLLQVNLDNKRILALEPLLEDVYSSMRPKPADYEVRRGLVRVFNEIAKEIFGNSKKTPAVVELGSFVMDLFTTASDLDLSVNFSNAAADFPREKKTKMLRKFAGKLFALQSKGHVYGVVPIISAKVPILKCVDRGTGIECDISVENRDGILKSELIPLIASIDERFQKLSFLMKIWANSHINNSKNKALNSLSIILMVAFHLQTRKPPVLPPFSVIFKDGNDPAAVAKSVSDLVDYGKRNHESLSQLFITLLFQLSSVEKLWPKGLCISNHSASWISKTWDSKVDPCISIEDFIDPSQNVSRAVGQKDVKRIYESIHASIRHIQSFLSGEVGFELKDLLFQPSPNSSSSLNQQLLHKKRGLKRKRAAASSWVVVDESIPTENPSTGDGWSRLPNWDWEAAHQNYLEKARIKQQQQASICWERKQQNPWAWGEESKAW